MAYANLLLIVYSKAYDNDVSVYTGICNSSFFYFFYYCISCICIYVICHKIICLLLLLLLLFPYLNVLESSVFIDVQTHCKFVILYNIQRRKTSRIPWSVCGTRFLGTRAMKIILVRRKINKGEIQRLPEVFEEAAEISGGKIVMYRYY